MDTILKCAAGVLIAAVLCLFLSKQGKDISLLLTIIVSGMVISTAVIYIEPTIDFIRQLQSIGKLDGSIVKILLKALGLCLIAEVCGMVCEDANNKALSKALNMLVTAAVLWMSLPLFTQLLELLEKILGSI